MAGARATSRRIVATSPLLCGRSKTGCSDTLSEGFHVSCASVSVVTKHTAGLITPLLTGSAAPGQAVHARRCEVFHPPATKTHDSCPCATERVAEPETWPCLSRPARRVGGHPSPGAQAIEPRVGPPTTALRCLCRKHRAALHYRQPGGLEPGCALWAPTGLPCPSARAPFNPRISVEISLE